MIFFAYVALVGSNNYNLFRDASVDYFMGGMAFFPMVISGIILMVSATIHRNELRRLQKSYKNQLADAREANGFDEMQDEYDEYDDSDDVPEDDSDDEEESFYRR